jgi:hypothetical protein
MVFLYLCVLGFFLLQSGSDISFFNITCMAGLLVAQADRVTGKLPLKGDTYTNKGNTLFNVKNFYNWVLYSLCLCERRRVCR